MQGWPGSSLVT